MILVIFKFIIYKKFFVKVNLSIIIETRQFTTGE